MGKMFLLALLTTMMLWLCGLELGPQQAPVTFGVRHLTCVGTVAVLGIVVL